MYRIWTSPRPPSELHLRLSGTVTDVEGKLLTNNFGEVELLNIFRPPFQLFDELKMVGKFRDIVSVKAQSQMEFFLISSKLRSILSSLNQKGIEFFDCTLYYLNQKIHDYSILNISERIDCIDDGNSEVAYYSYDENDLDFQKIYSIYKLELNHDKIPSQYLIFTLDRLEFSTIVVSDALVKLLESQGVSGFESVAINEFEL